MKSVLRGRGLGLYCGGREGLDWIEMKIMDFGYRASERKMIM